MSFMLSLLGLLINQYQKMFSSPLAVNCLQNGPIPSLYQSAQFQSQINNRYEGSSQVPPVPHLASLMGPPTHLPFIPRLYSNSSSASPPLPITTLSSNSNSGPMFPSSLFGMQGLAPPWIHSMNNHAQENGNFNGSEFNPKGIISPAFTLPLHATHEDIQDSKHPFQDKKPLNIHPSELTNIVREADYDTIDKKNGKYFNSPSNEASEFKRFTSLMSQTSIETFNSLEMKSEPMFTNGQRNNPNNSYPFPMPSVSSSAQFISPSSFSPNHPAYNCAGCTAPIMDRDINL